MASPLSFQNFHRFRPRLAEALAGYNRARFAADLGAGLTVGIVALPLAMAFAIASGVKPEQGLVTAVIAGFLISALGGSQVQIGGPAGAFIVIVYGIVQRYGLANLLIATSLAGLLLLVMGWLKLGVLVRYIPVSIVIGFTNGIAVLIGLSQLKDLLGLRIANMPADFFSQLAALAQHIHTFNPVALITGLACLGIVVLCSVQNFGYYGIMIWMPSFLSHKLGFTLTKSAFWTSVTIVGMMVGIWVFGQLADRIGRKPTFLLFQAGAVVMVLVYSRLSDPITMLWAGAVMGMFVNGMVGGYGALMSEAYPTQARATAQNVLFNIGRGVGGFGPVVVGALAAAYSFQVAIAMLAAIYVIDMLATVFLIPELKGSELD